jgi:hypothetical protein
MRELAKDRAHILQNQAMWVGRVDRPETGDQAPTELDRRAQRMTLIHQLQDEQAAAEAMLESLKEVCGRAGGLGGFGGGGGGAVGTDWLLPHN